MSIDLLNARPTLLVLDERAGQSSDHSVIEYKNGLPMAPVVWERVGNGQWGKVDLRARTSVTLGPRPDAAVWLGGTFFTPELVAGQVYTVEASDDPSFNPELVVPDPPIVMSATVIAQRKEPLAARVVADEPIVSRGGTWIGASTSTLSPAVLVFEIGLLSAVQHPDGTHFFPGGAAASGVVIDPATLHSIELSSGLVPGSTYFWVLRLIDTSGDWEERTGSVTLLRRTVSVTLTKFNIKNTGDKDKGEAWLRAMVYRGANLDHTYELGGHDNGKTVSAGDVGIPEGATPPGWTVTVGPLPPEVLSVGVSLRGSEYDVPVGITAHAASFNSEDEKGVPYSLDFFTGSGREAMHNQPFDVYAEPVHSGGGELRFSVVGQYSVSYS